MTDMYGESDEGKAQATSAKSDVMMLQTILFVVTVIATIVGDQLGLSVLWIIVTSGAVMFAVAMFGFIRGRLNRRRWRLPDDMRPPRNR